VNRETHSHKPLRLMASLLFAAAALTACGGGEETPPGAMAQESDDTAEVSDADVAAEQSRIQAYLATLTPAQREAEVRAALDVQPTVEYEDGAGAAYAQAGSGQKRPLDVAATPPSCTMQLNYRVPTVSNYNAIVRDMASVGYRPHDFLMPTHGVQTAMQRNVTIGTQAAMLRNQLQTSGARFTRSSTSRRIALVMTIRGVDCASVRAGANSYWGWLAGGLTMWAVSAAGYTLAAVYIPEWIPTIKPYVGCLSVMSGAVVKMAIDGFPPYRQATFEIAGSCIAGAAFTTAQGTGEYFASWGNRIQAGESLLPSWLQGTVRSEVSPAIGRLGGGTPPIF
jgi:hypothetical protein